MEITRYTLAECRRLLDDEKFWAQAPLPTSRLRMTSYVNNPRAKEDDVLLYTAHKDDRLVSFIAVLPDYMQPDGPEGERRPFGWPSSWWALRDASLGPAASILLFKVLADWPGGAIGLSGFSEVAREVYDASRRFKDLKVYDMHVYALALPREFKGRRIPVTAPVNALLRLKNRYYSSRARKSAVQWDVVDSIDDALDQFITEQTRNDLFPRDGALFNWLIKYPWITMAESQDDRPGSEMQRYHFSSRMQDFAQVPVRFTRNGETIGFIFFSRKNDYLIIKYAIFPDSEADAIKTAVEGVAVETGKPFLWCADERLNKSLLADRFFYLACKHINVPFYVGKQQEYDTNARLHYGLGDRVMT